MSFEKKTGRDIYFAQLEKELFELIDKKTGLLSLEYSKEVPCPICKSDVYEKIFTKRGYTFVRCLSCGMIFSNPQVLPDIVLNTYKKGLSSTELWMKVLSNQEERLWRIIYFEDILKKIELFFEPARLLDIGCAVGQFLMIAKNRGWKVSGLEYSQTGYEYCKNKLGLNVFCKPAKEIGIEENSFEAISLLGVLEHVTDPLGVLSEYKHLLTDNGVIAVVVPNVYSIANMILREKSTTFDGRNHLLYFSEKTLKNLFKNIGMEVVYSDTVLTGLTNIVKYFQYIDPYADDDRTEFLPPFFLTNIETSEKRLNLENQIIKNNLGLRLRMIARVSRNGL